MQELRDLVAQLRVENERLRQEQPSVSSLVSNTTPGNDAAARPILPGAGARSADRFVFVPRDRKCPNFCGASGILLEFSLALMGLQEKVKQQSSSAMPNVEILFHDQFVEFVLDPTLRRELKQLVRRQPLCTFLDVRGEAIRWEREGSPGGMRPRSQSLPVAYGFQCGVQREPQAESSSSRSEFADLREILKLQQEQIGQLTQGLARLQSFQSRNTSPRRGPVICRQCQCEGHFARDCDGQRAPPRSRPPSRFVSATWEEPVHSVQRSEISTH